MIFSVQRYLEDSFASQGLVDTDQYAVKIANIFSNLSPQTNDEHLKRSIHNIRTIFFRTNPSISRKDFESSMIRKLKSKFKKKTEQLLFPGGVQKEEKLLKKQNRRSLAKLLPLFRAAIEARAVDIFWNSRTKMQLQKKPEKIGQGLLAIFLQGVLTTGKGYVIRELGSGIGYVDIAVAFSTVLHLIELKILTSTSTFTGAYQLDNYMKTEGRNIGWLVIFDARPPALKLPISNSITSACGKIHVIIIDINPIVPSSLSK